MNTSTNRSRILVIDDNDAIHGDFRKTLGQQSPTTQLASATAALFGKTRPAAAESQSFDIESAHQGQEGLQKVEQACQAGDPYALAFVDMRMPPGWDGVETIQHLWQVDPELQVVICTAFSDYSWAQITAALGTTDRLLILKKPFDPMEVCQLASALSEKWNLKRQANLKVEQLEKMVHVRTAELRKLALLDKLTGLPNRAYFQDALRKAIARAESDPAFTFAVLFIDFDRFKVINDSQGHAVGDKLLTTFGERLHTAFDLKGLESSDDDSLIAARLGGDEFVILQRGIAGPQDATALAEKILAVTDAPYDIAGIEIHSTASIGIATSETGLRWSEDILRDADNAMYRAKSQGKARYVVFSKEMHHNAVARFNLETDLRRAIKDGQLYLEYQPIVTLTDAQLLGFEALIRWRHPERGVISPLEFIPIAEETGLILPIGRWVIEQAATQLMQWTRDMPNAAGLTVSVNCCYKQLADPHFVSALTAILARTGLSPRRLNIELTESTVMDHPETTHRVLAELKALGICLHMDDFGTGYSSLNYLHGLPLDTLKIDRSFINNVSQRKDYTAVINAIISLAHNLNIKVVAEGVESVEHTTMLCALDCDHAQGFFFAKPLPPEKAAAFITTQNELIRTHP